MSQDSHLIRVRLPSDLLDYVAEVTSIRGGSASDVIVAALHNQKIAESAGTELIRDDLIEDGKDPEPSPGTADADALAHAKRVAIAADRPDWDDLVAEERQAERDRMLQGLRLQAGDLTPAHAAEILATLLMRDADYADVFDIETRAAAATALVRVAQAAEKMAEAALVLEEAGL